MGGEVNCWEGSLRRVIKELEGALGVQDMLRGRVIEMIRGFNCYLPCHLAFTDQAYGLRTAC